MKRRKQTEAVASVDLSEKQDGAEEESFKLHTTKPRSHKRVIKVGMPAFFPHDVAKQPGNSIHA